VEALARVGVLLVAVRISDNNSRMGGAGSYPQP
jgi:hypothetical protein